MIEAPLPTTTATPLHSTPAASPTAAKKAATAARGSFRGIDRDAVTNTPNNPHPIPCKNPCRHRRRSSPRRHPTIARRRKNRRYRIPAPAARRRSGRCNRGNFRWGAICDDRTPPCRCRRCRPTRPAFDRARRGAITAGAITAGATTANRRVIWTWTSRGTIFWSPWRNRRRSGCRKSITRRRVRKRR